MYHKKLMTITQLSLDTFLGSIRRCLMSSVRPRKNDTRFNTLTTNNQLPEETTQPTTDDQAQPISKTHMGAVSIFLTQAAETVASLAATLTAHLKTCHPNFLTLTLQESLRLSASRLGTPIKGTKPSTQARPFILP